MLYKRHLGSVIWLAGLLLLLLFSQGRLMAPAFGESESTPGQPASAVESQAGNSESLKPDAQSPLPAQNHKAAPVVAEEFVLPNGLKVVVLEEHSFPVVSCLAWYKVGSRNEIMGSTGLSHLVEHLLFRNVGSFRKGEIGATIARVGGQFNGYTSDDFTAFFETLPASKLELALRIESERMRGAIFAEQDIQEEIANIQNEFESELKDPLSMLSKEVRASLFQQHPYHHPTMGWRNDVENLTVEQAKAYYDRYFWPDNATLVIAGDARLKPVRALVEKYFAGIARAPAVLPPLKFVEPAQHGERRVVVRHPGRQEILQVAYHAPALDDADAPAMVVMEKLWNAAYAGRLKSRLVDPKICASASASFEVRKDPGMFNLTCTAIPATASAQQKILDSLDAAINQMRAQPVSDVELRRAKNQAEFAFFTERDGPYRAGFHLGYFDSLSRWQNAYGWADRLRAVTVADVQRVARRYLNPDNRVVGWLAGASAPKPQQAKPSTVEQPKEPQKSSPSRQFERLGLTGYKDDDSAIGPENKSTFKGKLPQAVGSIPSAIKQLPAAIGSIPSAVKGVPSAIGNIPAAAASAVKGVPSAIGNIPAAAVSTIKEIPSALGAIPSATVSTIKEIPAALGAIPSAAVSAIKGLPAAIGSIASDVKEIPGAIGGIPSAISRQLAMLGPHGDPSGQHVVRRVLKNGMTFLLLENRLSPVVQIYGAVRAGDIYDPPGKKGLSALSAASLNQGSSKRGRTQMATQQEDLGLQPQHMLKFESSLETINFQARCLSRDLLSELEMIAESLSMPALEDEDVEKSRQDAIAAIKQGDDGVAPKVERALLRSLLVSGSPYCPSDPTEKSRSLSLLTASDEEKFFNSYIVPAGATIVLCGDIDVDQATNMAEKVFGLWCGKGNTQKVHLHQNQRRVLRTAIPLKDKSRSTICFGQLVPMAEGSPDYGSLLLADGILINHPLVSRLTQAMSAEPTLAHAVADEDLESRIDPLANALTWTLSVSVESNAVPSTVQSLQAELKKLGRSGVTGEELSEVKRYLLGAFPVRNLATMSSAGRTILEASMHGEETDAFTSTLTSIRSANLESVNKVIKNSFKPDLSTLVIAGAGQSIRAVRNQVVSQGAAGRAQPGRGARSASAGKVETFSGSQKATSSFTDAAAGASSEPPVDPPAGERSPVISTPEKAQTQSSDIAGKASPGNNPSGSAKSARAALQNSQAGAAPKQPIKPPAGKPPVDAPSATSASGKAATGQKNSQTTKGKGADKSSRKGASSAADARIKTSSGQKHESAEKKVK